jgi:ABC-type Zn uptake system ZnuABC Zn-binding protein ZnuA
VRRALLLALSIAALTGCADDGPPSGGAELTVVATTTHVGDLVRSVGGARVEVDQVLAPNADPHDYEPRPSDVRAVRDARLVVRSGGDVDEWLGDVLDEAGGDARRLTLTDVVAVERSGGDEDPHWWQDPRNAERAIGAIAAELTRADPAGAPEYRERAAAYLRRLRALDARVAACIGRLPASERELVTDHDALGYYARRYGLRVVGAAIPSLSTRAQASAKETERLIDRIRADRVRAIFPERALSARLEEAIARESGARVGDPLWADTLGPRGSSGATYIESIDANTRAIVDGLGGGRVSCARGSRGTRPEA